MRALVVTVTLARAVAALPPGRPTHPLGSLQHAGVSLAGGPVFHNPWTTEHHDSRNSGQSTAVYGVGSFNGTCQLAAAHALTGSFPSSGVTSSDGRTLYVGR